MLWTGRLTNFSNLCLQNKKTKLERHSVTGSDTIYIPRKYLLSAWGLSVAVAILYRSESCSHVCKNQPPRGHVRNKSFAGAISKEIYIERRVKIGHVAFIQFVDIIELTRYNEGLQHLNIYFSENRGMNKGHLGSALPFRVRESFIQRLHSRYQLVRRCSRFRCSKLENEKVMRRYHNEFGLKFIYFAVSLTLSSDRRSRAKFCFYCNCKRWDGFQVQQCFS